MKKDALFKNGILLIEVLLCLAALFVMPFRHYVAGSETDMSELPVTAQAVETQLTEPAEVPDAIEETVKAQETEPEEAAVTAESMTEEVQETQEAYEVPEAETAKEEHQDEWCLFLSNRNHYIPLDYMPELTKVSGGYEVDERIAEDLGAMFDAAKEDGIRLRIVSAYRNKEKQERLFKNKLRRCRKSGKTDQEVYADAASVVSIPGTSEHQLGLAIDVLGGGYGSLNEGFGDTEAGKWLKDNCSDYGFILRYPKGKEDITGIVYEPWHFRYVGPYAKEITDRGITLEEYLNE